MKDLLKTLVTCLLILPSISQGKSRNCHKQVENIFAYMISVQKEVPVDSVEINATELTRYEWSINTKTPKGDTEYLAIVETEGKCHITSMVEAESEVPKYEQHWEK